MIDTRAKGVRLDAGRRPKAISSTDVVSGLERSATQAGCAND